MKFTISSIKSRAFWLHVFSYKGIKSMLSIYGFIWLIIGSIDFFEIYTRDNYASYFFLVLIFISVAISILLRRPIKSISIPLPKYDLCIQVRIENLFQRKGAIMISTNTEFEADVANGKISKDSLQGQFTAKYYTGNQDKLIDEINEKLMSLNLDRPYPMGTTIEIHTHGKTFYLTAMAKLNENGNASSNILDIENALKGLWEHVKTHGELQELAIPVIGTGRGRILESRKKIIGLVAESFVQASTEGKFTDTLTINIRPEDAVRFKINLYEIKDYLNHLVK